MQIALPTTSQGKNVITNENYIRTKNELKPEYGFSISDYRYNAQTRNIDIYVENIGLSTQGTKGRTLMVLNLLFLRYMIF